MCSQYEIVKPISEIIHLAKLLPSHNILDLRWQTHVYPFSPAPVITAASDKLNLSLMNYSLIPSWSKAPKPKFSTYNARLDRPSNNSPKLELIYDAPTWKIPFQKQRCIVPLTGFFESCRIGTHAGNIVKFAPDQNQLLWAAGLWDSWTNVATGEIIYSFAILTDEPCPFIQEVGHDRQPVFLSLDNARLWLNYHHLAAPAAYDFLKSQQEDVKYQVSNYRSLKGFVQHDLFS